MEVKSQETRGSQYEVGSRLAASVIEGCTIFIGTVRELGTPVRDDSIGDDRDATFHTKISLKIDEWIWNRQADLGPMIQLDQTLTPERRRLGSEGRSAWDGVNLRIGARLLVALNKRETGDLKYELVVSDEHLFLPIQQALAWHAEYARQPNEVLNVSQMLNGNTNSVFSSYFVSYLYRGGTFGNHDYEALALGRLLANAHLSQSSSAFLRMTLARFMLSEFDPLSDPTRRDLMETLTTAGAGEDLQRAADAILILLRLSDGKQLELKPYLTSQERERLIQNYRALIREGKIESGHVDFESQLNLHPSKQ